ncbi:MAG: hypothetical protein V4638_11875 [Bacteroidota bacterium]
MKYKLSLLVLLFITQLSFAQKDSIPQPQTIVEVYDVVAIYYDHTDSRGHSRRYTSEVKGEILSYDESTGQLTFKALDGKMYSLKSTDYKYFQYKKEFVKKVKQVIVKERKSSGFEFTVGLSAGYFNLNQELTTDDYFINGFEGSADIPICLKVGAGMVLNKNSVAGLTGEYAVWMDNSSYFNVGARYQYMYNPTKNAAFYLPVELKYSRYQFSSQYSTSDTTDLGGGSWQYPGYLNTKVATNNLELNIGQGISFALKNKKSISLELMLLKQFILSQSFKSESERSPTSKFGIIGAKLNVSFNF